MMIHTTPFLEGGMMYECMKIFGMMGVGVTALGNAQLNAGALVTFGSVSVPCCTAIAKGVLYLSSLNRYSLS
jgi:hypothetical protein